MTFAIDIRGQRFGKLTVIKKAGRDASKGVAIWQCECACGRTTAVRSDNLRDGSTKSCGCHRRELARGHVAKAAVAWQTMMAERRKPCRQCKVEKPFSDFQSNGKNRSPKPICKACTRKSDRASPNRGNLAPKRAAEAVRRYLEGFSYAEIATRFRVPESRVWRAIDSAGIASRGHKGIFVSPLLTPDVIDLASEMAGTDPTRRDIGRIARKLDVPRKALARALCVPTKTNFSSRRPELDQEIGTLPPSHPFYKLDQQMARARARPRHAYEGGLGASSLVRFEDAA